MSNFIGNKNIHPTIRIKIGRTDRNSLNYRRI